MRCQLMTEPFRMLREFNATMTDLTIGWYTLHNLPPTPAREPVPVLVIPGMLAGDDATIELRKYLIRCGHLAVGWNLGINVGPTAHALNMLKRQLADLYAAHGKPVALVGWSLGGIYARWLAHQQPWMVREVFCLGSPWAISAVNGCAAARLFQILNCTRRIQADTVMAQSRQSLPVHSTAIFSRTDAVVSPELCREIVSGRTESIEVPGSHAGLCHNPAAAKAIARRLARALREEEK